jgi:hypothetical protein
MIGLASLYGRFRRPGDVVTKLPEWVEAKVQVAPRYSARRGLAELLSELFGPISPRTLEDRPFTWRLSNGRAVTETRAAVEAEFVRFDAALKYRGGRAKKTVSAVR